MKTLYARIKPKLGATRFFRCGIEFGQAWTEVRCLDDATAQRLEEEQMLEVTETRPAELDEPQAGDSAAALVPDAVVTAPPAPAPAAAEAAAAKAAAKPTKKTK